MLFRLIFNLKYDFNHFVKGLSAKVGVGYNNYVAETSSKTRDYVRAALTQSGVDAITILSMLIHLMEPMLRYKLQKDLEQISSAQTSKRRLITIISSDNMALMPPLSV